MEAVMTAEKKLSDPFLTPGFFFAAPALAAIAVFFFVPVAAAVALSFTDYDIYAVASWSNLRFVAIGNYSHLLRNTLYFVVIGGPLTIGISLGAALLLNARLVRFKGFFRTVFFLPVVTTLVAVSVVWRYVYHPRFGLLNRALGLCGVAPIDWLGDPFW